jgi:hypothetical protein
MDMDGYTTNVTTETRVRGGTMPRFRTLAKVVFVAVLLTTGCTPHQDAKSTPGTAASPFMVAGIVESVSLSGWVFLSESTTGIEIIELTEQTRLKDSEGNPITLCAVQTGQSIQAAGEVFGSSLLATQITVQDEQILDEAPGPVLSAILEMPSHLTNGKTVELRFTLVNNSEAGLYVLTYFTPLEGRLMGEILCVQRDGQTIPYKGPEAERADPTPDAYVFLDAGASVSATVDLAAAYDFSEAGEYTIGFSSPRMSHVARTEGEMATSVDDLGPVAMPSNQVWVMISADSALGEAETMGYIVNLYEQGGQWHISFDPVEWLTGEDAVKAIVEDGLCDPSQSDCEPPNGFYIRNGDEQPISVPLSEQVTILMQTLSHAPDGNFYWDEPIGLDRFRQILSENSASHLRDVPYWITVDGGAVTAIREQYVP